MRKQLVSCSLLAVFAVAAWHASSIDLTAAPPWQSLVNFKRVDANPNNSYTLSEDQGPWMVLATTFSGDDAMSDARALVLELRKRHKLEAYTHERTFDYSEPVIGRGLNRHGEAKTMFHQRNDRILEVAVLVGNHGAVDDAELDRTLQKIKSLHPESITGKKAEQSDAYLEENALADFLLAQRREASKKGDKGPLHMAFVVPNPLLPPSYFRPGGVDKFVADMNAGIKHSLLTCKAQYTVKVATFNGQAVVDPKDIARIEDGGTMSSRLEQAALNAHRMCEALRAKGYEAYEFHDRYASMVTVGGFDTIGMQQFDGSFEYNKPVLDIVRKFSAKPVYRGVEGVQTNGDHIPQSILGLPFDMEPTPIEVPRRSFARDYAGQ
ncbi:MAG: hypothetical protein WEA31_04505 [Pirellulales bacterium]